MTTKEKLIAQANKEIFELARDAYDRGAGCDNYIELHKDGQFFMDSMEENDLLEKYLIHTIRFSVSIYSEIELSDTTEESGAWQRKYYIKNETQKHYPNKAVVIKTSELIKMLSE
jgi:hypothetical protein